MRRTWSSILVALTLIAWPAAGLAQAPARGRFGSDDPLRPYVPAGRAARAERIPKRPYLQEPSPPPMPVTRTSTAQPRARHQYYPTMQPGIRQNHNVPWENGNLGRPHCTPPRYIFTRR